MDKDRREAERSGDPIRYALELRRSGEDLRAKRLLQELAWDNNDALTVLDDLYPIWPEHEEILADVECRDSAWYSYANHIAGSPDPRVNRRLADAMPQNLKDGGAESSSPYYQNYFELRDCRSQTLRLHCEDYWLDRLEWIEPLPEEMTDFLDWLQGIQPFNDWSGLYEYSQCRLGWTLYRWGFGDLLRCWAESGEQTNWRERTLVERLEKTLSVKLVPKGQAIPSWLKWRLLPSFREARNAALPRVPYFPGNSFSEMSGEPAEFLKEDFKRGHLLFVRVPMETDPKKRRKISPKKIQFLNTLVSSWQEMIGDRVIKTECWLEYVILWEFGQLKTVLKQIIDVVHKTKESSGDGHGLTIGVASVSGDIKASFALAKSRCEKAVAKGVNYLPECLTD